MNFAQPPKFKNKFKALSLKFAVAGQSVEVEFQIKAAPNFSVRKLNSKA